MYKCIIIYVGGWLSQCKTQQVGAALAVAVVPGASAPRIPASARLYWRPPAGGTWRLSRDACKQLVPVCRQQRPLPIPTNTTGRSKSALLSEISSLEYIIIFFHYNYVHVCVNIEFSFIFAVLFSIINLILFYFSRNVLWQNTEFCLFLFETLSCCAVIRVGHLLWFAVFRQARFVWWCAGLDSVRLCSVMPSWQDVFQSSLPMAMFCHSRKSSTGRGTISNAHSR